MEGAGIVMLLLALKVGKGFLKTILVVLALAALAGAGWGISTTKAKYETQQNTRNPGTRIGADFSVRECTTDTPSVASGPPPSAPPQFSAAELEKLAAPIALHPDPLIAIILPASVYPLKIVQAARFVKDTNNIPKLDEQPWDENVKAVAQFPELIQKMNDDLTWTMDLGQAFLDQQKELMDTIQMLRAKANASVVC